MPQGTKLDEIFDLSFTNTAGEPAEITGAYIALAQFKTPDAGENKALALNVHLATDDTKHTLTTGRVELSETGKATITKAPASLDTTSVTVAVGAEKSVKYSADPSKMTVTNMKDVQDFVGVGWDSAGNLSFHGLKAGTVTVKIKADEGTNYQALPEKEIKVTATPKSSGDGGGSSSGGSSSGGGSTGGGGSSGGPSSGGSTNTPTTSGGTTSVGVTPSVSNGSATATVSGSAAQTMVSDAVKNNSDNVTVKVNVPSGSTADSVTANVPASAVASLAKDTNASLTVDSPVADVTIPNSALADLGGTSGNVTVTAAKNGTDSVTITVQKGGQTVGALSGGMKVNVPVSAAAAQAGSGLVAVLVDANGSQTVLPKSTLSGGEMKVLLDSGSATLKFVDNSKSFVDSDTHWAAGAVDFVSSRNLFQGTSPTEFSPEMPMNRAMLVTVLHRLEREPSASVYSFSDVPTDSYYAEATAWAVGMGITNGEDGVFNGGGNISREQLAAMLYRYAQKTDAGKGTMGSYAGMGGADMVSSWASDAMRWAVGSGIITGDNGNLNPGAPASRAEVATMLERFVNVITK